MLKIDVLPVGMIGTCCYLVHDDAGEFLCIIDPGGDADEIVQLASGIPAKKRYILLTHAHVDHISGVGGVAKAFPDAKVWVHPADREMYASKDNALLPWLPAAKDLPEIMAETPQIPGMEILHLPGHTPGGAGFYFPADKVLFSGDTLFADSVGRTDLPGGNWEQLKKSITETIFALPEDVKVCCGHGPATSVGHEKKHNPYL
ncbi:MAG: MBL fold metallo-hydrolase [Lentisphaeria bacterium]|nr:MBL fold metallo-hydrolase [Lentisphaeria bacterium]